MLLDNQAFDDAIWLKHYRVDYSCVEDDDSDGDGVTDGDEVYIHNTHPLLVDSDNDGWENNIDNCPEDSNSDQADLDKDGMGDLCDQDADGDGQSNDDEEACGSDPLDKTSLSPDLDEDMLPNCVDDDDDGDGQTDTDEETCGSDPLDATSISPDFDAENAPDCVDPDDDNDGVVDEADSCPGTLIPDPTVPASGYLRKNRYALMDNDQVFDRNIAGSNEATVFTTTDTGGCNASQIADAMGLGKAHYKYGITQSVLEAWVASQP
jgi:hypothetical protein